MPPVAVAHENWPIWARTFEDWSKPGEVGVGDTARRVFSWLGGELFKALAYKLGMPCGCTGRQVEWNTLYPYATETQPSQSALADEDSGA